MSVLRYPPSTNALQKSLASQLDSGVTASLTLNNTTNIPNKPGVCVIDRIDSAGNKKDVASREFIAYTGTSGATLTGLTRNVDNSSSDQTHSVGAIVEFIPDVVWAQSIVDALANLVDPSTLALDTTKVADLSTAQTLTNKTLDSFETKGIYSAGNTGTALTISAANGDRQTCTLTGNCTFTWSNFAAGSLVKLYINEDATGGRTVTLPTGKWPGGAAGTFTTTASAKNTLIIDYDGTDYMYQLAAGFA